MIALVYCLLPAWGLAQLTVEGRVMDDETGEPLSYASIRLQGTVIGVMSDEEGFFEFSMGGL